MKVIAKIPATTPATMLGISLSGRSDSLISLPILLMSIPFGGDPPHYPFASCCSIC